jgi:hypothetical protein
VKQDFEGLVGRVLADAEPIIVETANGRQVVVMPIEEFQFLARDCLLVEVSR